MSDANNSVVSDFSHVGKENTTKKNKKQCDSARNIQKSA